MNPFQRYLLDEFVEDYRQGRMSRRDFVMKVIGVSGGMAAATDAWARTLAWFREYLPAAG
jgi:hypothetical protein